LAHNGKWDASSHTRLFLKMIHDPWNNVVLAGALQSPCGW
jgi:hypothetical protein